MYNLILVWERKKNPHIYQTIGWHQANDVLNSNQLGHWWWRVAPDRGDDTIFTDSVAMDCWTMPHHISAVCFYFTVKQNLWLKPSMNLDIHLMLTGKARFHLEIWHWHRGVSIRENGVCYLWNMELHELCTYLKSSE